MTSSLLRMKTDTGGQPDSRDSYSAACCFLFFFSDSLLNTDLTPFHLKAMMQADNLQKAAIYLNLCKDWSLLRSPFSQSKLATKHDCHPLEKSCNCNRQYILFLFQAENAPESGIYHLKARWSGRCVWLILVIDLINQVLWLGVLLDFSCFEYTRATGTIKCVWMNTICYTVWVRSRVDLVLFPNAESLLNDQLSPAKFWNDCLPCDN